MSKTQKKRAGKVNALAHVVRTPLFRQRVVENKKAYKRKDKHAAKHKGWEGCRYPI